MRFGERTRSGTSVSGWTKRGASLNLPVTTTGGTVTTYSTYTVHSFTTSGILELSLAKSVDILIVGGGGGGGTNIGGGGGGGEVVTYTGTLAAGRYACLIGSGGRQTGAGTVATSGSKSEVRDLTNGNTLVDDAAGGVGGGGGAGNGGTSGSGNAGGSGNGSSEGGGGGGNSAIGSGTTGGAGSSNAYRTGSNVTYGGGGGGSTNASSGSTTGGAGGGGQGMWLPTSGAENSGGGGGGGAWLNHPNYPFGQNGGSGIIVVRYTT